MSDRTTLLFALPAFRVLEVSLEPDGGRRVLVECLAPGLMEALIAREDESHGSTEEVPGGASGAGDADGGRGAE
jgi:hypothetical protein